MRYAPASTFPTGIFSDHYIEAKVHDDFWIAETQVTYALWYEVWTWAIDNGYTFFSVGREGGDSHWEDGNFGGVPTTRKNEPVTGLHWYDSITWCNALSEMFGYEPVYTLNGFVIKTATGISHFQVVAENRNGFRLPTSLEWELAARYRGTDSSFGAEEFPAGSGQYWTPGNYASGATGPAWRPTEPSSTQAAAWYDENSGEKTQDVGQKPAGGNGLGVFDMSGNLWEWCFTQSALGRVIRGGSWWHGDFTLPVGYEWGSSPEHFGPDIGIRLVRNVP